MGGLALAALSGKALLDWRKWLEPRIPCRMLGPSFSIGHRIRDGQFKDSSPPAEKLKARIAIVGGGMAGLSAGWWLKKHGVSDFTLLEMEEEVGGNSASGKNQISPYPWGAHYIPLANPESHYVRMLFQELGIIEGYDSKGQAIYSDLYLCHEPQERLLKDGSFQEGMVPRKGLQPADKESLARFFQLVHDYRSKKGADGKPAFAIPVDLSSCDEEFISLDRISMADWLAQHKLNSRPLLWYVNYCCRDDYGSTIEKVSAWAGIHYFAGRRGTAANAELNSVVTWPEGNGFIASKLKDQLRDHIRKRSAVTAIEQSDGRITSSFIETSTGKKTDVESSFLVFAAPRFIARHVIRGYDGAPESLSYAPWLVANVSVRRVPESKGEGLSWDNVSYTSDSLGYVVATHQNITTRAASTVLTYYYPLSDLDPSLARRRLLETSADHWCDLVVADLEKMHPGIKENILSVDLWPWGHGMIRPSVGFLWGQDRKRMMENFRNVYFAHSDMSGMSNFEEAQYRGVQAAESIMAKLS